MLFVVFVLTQGKIGVLACVCVIEKINNTGTLIKTLEADRDSVVDDKDIKIKRFEERLAGEERKCMRLEEKNDDSWFWVVLGIS